MIEFNDISKVYNKPFKLALENLNLALKNGEILGFAGLNGAGKTTAMRIASGVMIPTSGSVVIDGIDMMKNRNAAVRNVGWIPEEDNFDAHYKALDLMRYYCGLYGMTSKEARNRSNELLELVDLGSSINTRLRKFSHGMKKRFMVATALIANPNNMLLDEPFNGLDPQGIRFLNSLIIRLKDEGKSFFISSHILTELGNIADRVAIIHRGKVSKILDRNEMKGGGRAVIRIRIDRITEKTHNILGKYGNVSILENTITVFDPKVGPSEVNSVSEELTKAGFKVYECIPSEEQLEDLFFKAIRDSSSSSADGSIQ
ncbi:MAG: ABC transporter ATP-binding protein [Thermoplasmataceae archaeon]